MTSMLLTGKLQQPRHLLSGEGRAVPYSIRSSGLYSQFRALISMKGVKSPVRDGANGIGTAAVWVDIEFGTGIKFFITQGLIRRRTK